MKVVVQRVSRAAVRVNGDVTGAIGKGLLLLLGVGKDDDGSEVDWLARKCCELRIFPDDEGKMSRSVEDIGGGVLVVSQFTLYGRVNRGRRPDFTHAAPPELAERLYDAFVAAIRARGVNVETGVFGAMMDVELVNDGPVTILLER
ncbi:MAG: D-tyrosyl-tRNA(Tyr) deacylase [Candidatus Cloacimonetes bacterium]|nr:D-tyrosyl-tRNA(Tyr) deacylase [Candidatus Cloacimonadota bacterium]